MKDKLASIEKQIIDDHAVTDQQIEALKQYNKDDLIKLFVIVYEHYIINKELEAEEIEVLDKLQNSLSLANKEISYTDRIRPYLYVNKIRKDGGLLTVDLQIKGIEKPILKKDEVVHYAENAVLKEIRSVSLGYSGGSHGVSIRIAKGLSYRVGAHSGQIVREDRLVTISQGVLIVTSKRLFLQPLPGNKPASIPLEKILSYNCFENGLEVYKDGREKGYFFEMTQKGSIEIFSICLGQLLGKNE
jgi:hypothetical protein